VERFLRHARAHLALQRGAPARCILHADSPNVPHGPGDLRHERRQSIEREAGIHS